MCSLLNSLFLNAAVLLTGVLAVASAGLTGVLAVASACLTGVLDVDSACPTGVLFGALVNGSKRGLDTDHVFMLAVGVNEPVESKDCKVSFIIKMDPHATHVEF